MRSKRERLSLRHAARLPASLPLHQHAPPPLTPPPPHLQRHAPKLLLGRGVPPHPGRHGQQARRLGGRQLLGVWVLGAGKRVVHLPVVPAVLRQDSDPGVNAAARAVQRGRALPGCCARTACHTNFCDWVATRWGMTCTRRARLGRPAAAAAHPRVTPPRLTCAGGSSAQKPGIPRLPHDVETHHGKKAKPSGLAASCCSAGTASKSGHRGSLDAPRRSCARRRAGASAQPAWRLWTTCGPRTSRYAAEYCPRSGGYSVQLIVAGQLPRVGR